MCPSSVSMMWEVLDVFSTILSGGGECVSYGRRVLDVLITHSLDDDEVGM